jgi:hypothetical protein
MDIVAELAQGHDDHDPLNDGEIVMKLAKGI